MTIVAYVEWPDGIIPSGSDWDKISQDVKNSDADILVTNEMPFGSWLPVGPKYNADQAKKWNDLHEHAIEALTLLDIPNIISSRPIITKDKLVNEAFVLSKGEYKTLHHKHFFPSEDGWHEASWFEKERDGFEVFDIAGIKVGVLLCTELMFNEKARDYGRLGVDLIVAPRASGQNIVNWQAAGSMAALVGGCYVISSNRTGQSNANIPNFGGYGFCYAPGGEFISNTTHENPISIVEINTKLTRKAQSEYPCYLRY